MGGSNSFNFHANGTEVCVHFESEKETITFSKVGTTEIKVLSTSNLNSADKTDLQFFISIGENDRVRIVDSW